MKYIPLLSAAVLLFSFCGCSDTSKKPVKAALEAVPYKICIEANNDESREECKSGAYIEEDIPYNEIKKFEQKTQTENDIYIARIKRGEDFPMSFVVSCFAKGKTPMLVYGADSRYEEMKSVAQICGSFNLPMLVEMDYNNETDMYATHSELFRAYAPKVSLIYGFNSDRESYAVPNFENVDMIAVNAFEKMSNGSIDSEYTNIYKWCEIYAEKPVVVNIAVPVFTDDRCNYAISEAANEIENIYSLAGACSNIYAINYMSFAESDNGIRTYSSRLSESEELVNAYGRAVACLTGERYYNETARIGYVIGDTAVVSKDTADVLGIKIRSGAYSNLAEPLECTIDEPSRKMYVTCGRSSSSASKNMVHN